MKVLPQRRADVLFDTAGDEVVVFDATTNTALSLTPVGSRVFAACDGATSPAALEAELGSAALESALDELRRAGLLAGTSRRSVLVGGLAGVGSIAAMVALPTAAAASSSFGGGGSGTGGATITARPNSDSYGNFFIVDTGSSVAAGTLTSFRGYASVSGDGVYFLVVAPDHSIAFVTGTKTVTAGSLFTIPAGFTVEEGSHIGVGFAGDGRVPFDFGGDDYSYTGNNSGVAVVGQTPTYEGNQGRTYSFDAIY